MLFQSYAFPVFLAAAAAVYYAVPARMRIAVLLVANLVFFCFADWRGAVWIALSVFTTWGTGLLLERVRGGMRRWLLAACLFCNLALLVLFRYLPVWTELRSVLPGGRAQAVRPDPASAFGLAAPLGISFYTLEAVGYLADVYRGRCRPQKSLLRHAVFLSFFPNLASGPIERADRFFEQLDRNLALPRRRLWDYDRIVRGLISILLGFFMKLVAADRAAILVDLLYGMYADGNSFTMLMAALFYSVQLYCDFASYSLIAVGTAQLLGFELTRNFRQPYLAVGFSDFWKRWHVSLSGWLRDYIYIPLGGSRKGALRKYGNLILVFAVSGLWHGGAPTFLVWGLLHGLCQILEDLVKRGYRLAAEKAAAFRRKRGGAAERSAAFQKTLAGTAEKVPDALSGAGQPPSPGNVGGAAAHKSCPGMLRRLPVMFGKGIYRLFTFAAVSLLWILFRSETLEMAGTCYRNLFTRPQGFLLARTFLFAMGLDQVEFGIAVGAALFLFVLDLVSECRKKEASVWLSGAPAALRFGICLALLLAVFVVGEYGSGYDASRFIYMGF